MAVRFSMTGSRILQGFGNADPIVIRSYSWIWLCACISIS